MRISTALLVFVLSCLAAFSQKENQAITSKIEKVTVFLKGAQVERVAKQNLPVGKYNIVFNGISPSIDKKSIQLKADGKLTILSVTHQVNFLKEQQLQEENKLLGTQKDAWNDKLTAEKNMKSVYTQEIQMIIANQNIKGDATLKAAELKESADFQRARLTELYTKLQDNDHNIKKMETEINKINRQLTELNQKKDLSTSEVVVAVDVKEGTTANFRLSYLVRQSSWYPTYDIRVQDISQPLALQVKANIKQQSGEDWKEVKMFLSTGNPDENSTKPVLAPWYLRYYYPEASSQIRIRGTSSISPSFDAGNIVTGYVRNQRGEPIAAATIMAKGTNTAVVSDMSGYFSIAMPANASTISVSSVGFQNQEFAASRGQLNIVLNESANQLQEVVVTGLGISHGSESYYESSPAIRKKKEENNVTTSTSYQPTTTIFEIESPYSVPDDGKLYTVDINGYELTALYEYYAAPKLDPSAYLTAKVIDWQELNLLPGDANLFFEGTFLGTSFLDVNNAGDTLNLSLGKDKGVVVKRTMLKEYSSRKFLGSNKTDSRQYEISIRNNKAQPVKVIVEDQFPVSTNKDIEVDKLSYDNAKLDDDTRKIAWSVVVETKKENKLQFGYVVKYPRDKVLHLE